MGWVVGRVSGGASMRLGRWLAIGWRLDANGGGPASGPGLESLHLLLLLHPLVIHDDSNT